VLHALAYPCVSTIPILLSTNRHSGPCGWFSETDNERALAKDGITSFVQGNQLMSTRKGTIDGLHFQLQD
jgi:dTDP-4-dehydrorhamnose 3,5-epimerase-like enzyme